MLVKVNQWTVLIVDDEEFIHESLEMNLRDIEYEDKKVVFIHAYSAKEAEAIVKNNQDIALIILDVMMERDNSGLEFVRFIREELRNEDVRILLHTGQPGIAPKKEVVNKYMIDAYLDKNIVDNDDSYAAVRLAIRAYKERLELKEAATKSDTELLIKITDNYVYLIKNYDLLKERQEVLSKVNSMVHSSQEILASYTLEDLKKDQPLGTKKSQRLSFDDYSSLIQIHNIKIILTQVPNDRFQKEKVIIFNTIANAAKKLLMVKILPDNSKKELEKHLEELGQKIPI